MNQRQLFIENLAQTSHFPLQLSIDKARGVYLFDKEGKPYIDLISGIGVSNVGHGHTDILTAITQQTKQYLHTMVYGEYILSPQVQYAKALSDTLPEELSVTYFVNSGSEAVEGALKLAKRWTGKRNIVAFKNAYHGATHGALSATGNDILKQNFRPLVPGFTHIRYNECQDLIHINDSTAAVILELVQAEAGVIPIKKDFLASLKAKCKQHRALLIFDEIQTGMGRTGTLWASEQFEIYPDILVSAKSLGGGMPLGCFISSPQIMSCLKNNPPLGHITTFGGHPVSCAAGLSALKVVKKILKKENIEGKSELIQKNLRHTKIKAIRKQGLLMALEFESPAVLQKIINKALDLGVITDWFLFNDQCMRIAPPLTINEKEINMACDIILRACEEA